MTTTAKAPDRGRLGGANHAPLLTRLFKLQSVWILWCCS